MTCETVTEAKGLRRPGLLALLKCVNLAGVLMTLRKFLRVTRCDVGAAETGGLPCIKVLLHAHAVQALGRRSVIQQVNLALYTTG